MVGARTYGHKRKSGPARHETDQRQPATTSQRRMQHVDIEEAVLQTTTQNADKEKIENLARQDALIHTLCLYRTVSLSVRVRRSI